MELNSTLVGQCLLYVFCDWFHFFCHYVVGPHPQLGLKTIVVGASTGKNGARRAIERLQSLLITLGVDKEILNYSLPKASKDIKYIPHVVLYKDGKVVKVVEGRDAKSIGKDIEAAMK